MTPQAGPATTEPRCWWCPVYGWTHLAHGDSDCKAIHTTERTLPDPRSDT